MKKKNSVSYLPRAHLRLDRGKGISHRRRWASGNTTTVGSSTSQPLKCFRVSAQPTAKQTCLANAFHSADLLDARCRVDRRELCKAPACCPLPHPPPPPHGFTSATSCLLDPVDLVPSESVCLPGAPQYDPLLQVSTIPGHRGSSALFGFTVQSWLCVPSPPEGSQGKWGISQLSPL